MKSNELRAPSCESRTSIALDDESRANECSRSRLEQQQHQLKELSWSRCSRQRENFIIAVIIVLLNLTSIECLQARQEGKPQPQTHITLNFITSFASDYHEPAELFISLRL